MQVVTPAPSIAKIHELLHKLIMMEKVNRNKYFIQINLCVLTIETFTYLYQYFNHMIQDARPVHY